MRDKIPIPPGYRCNICLRLKVQISRVYVEIIKLPVVYLLSKGHSNINIYVYINLSSHNKVYFFNPYPNPYPSGIGIALRSRARARGRFCRLRLRLCFANPKDNGGGAWFNGKTGTLQVSYLCSIQSVSTFTIL